MIKSKPKLTEMDRQNYCSGCRWHKHENHDETDACNQDHGTINFEAVKITHTCKYRATATEYTEMIASKTVGAFSQAIADTDDVVAKVVLWANQIEQTWHESKDVTIDKVFISMFMSRICVNLDDLIIWIKERRKAMKQLLDGNPK